MPSIIRECTRIKKGKIILLDKIKKRDFRYLLKHSEKVAEKLWSNKEDDFWDNIWTKTELVLSKENIKNYLTLKENANKRKKHIRQILY